ncbi:hypothetical protein DB42_BK00240 [Neochlamydia sp. EPS4]|nr:hypothetical protein DB42_BK00240 [Neochlamydia sp. EPS4]
MNNHNKDRNGYGKIAFWQEAFINIFSLTCRAQEKMLDKDVR